MPPIVLIAGSPASGKSTVARTLAASAPAGLHIPVDDLRTMVVGGVVHPGPAWGADLIRQLELARQTAGQMAQRYHAAGFLTVIDDFWDPHSRLQEYAGLEAAAPVLRVLLQPAVEVVLARNHARQSPAEFRDQMDDGIRMIYADLAAQAAGLLAQRWHVLDTSRDTVADSVSRVRALLAGQSL